MKTKKHRQVHKKGRPKNVWNALRKLERHLKKTDIQASLFLESLDELREAMSSQIKSDIVQRLCNTVNGDILHALADYNMQIESVNNEDNREQHDMLVGIFDTLVNVLDLSPYKKDGQRFFMRPDFVKRFDFEEHPEALDDESTQEFEVEVLQCGWKVKDKVVVKPKVFQVKSR